MSSKISSWPHSGENTESNSNILQNTQSDEIQPEIDEIQPEIGAKTMNFMLKITDTASFD